MQKRMTKDDRKTQILEAAIVAANAKGFASVRLHHIAEQAQCSTSLVMSHYATMPQVRRAIMRAAIKRELLGIIANGYVTGDPTAKKISSELKIKALASLTH